MITDFLTGNWGKRLGQYLVSTNSNKHNTTRVNMALLRKEFRSSGNSHVGNVNRPPRSCDLPTLDLFMWTYPKDCDYTENPLTLKHLKPKFVKLWRRHRLICDQKWSQVTSEGLKFAKTRVE